jgi:transglutaminase-like putative cysteine protease
MRMLLGWLVKGLRPREGWIIVFLVFAALACPAAALMRVTRGIGAERLLVLTFMAALTGLLLAHSRLRSGWSALVGALLIAGLVVVVLGGLLPPLSLVWREVGNLAAWLQRGGLRQGVLTMPLPFASAGFVWQRLVSFGERLWAWLHAVNTGAPPDRIGFLLLAALLAWGLSLFGSWQVFRRRAPIAGLLPSGIGVVMIVFLSGGGTTFLLVYLFCLLGLLAAMHLWTHQQRWEQTGTDYPGELGLDLSQFLFPWLVVLVLVAGFFPILHVRSLSIAFGRLLDRPWSAVEQASKRLSGVIDSAYPGGFAPDRLPNEHLLGGGPDLDKVIVLYVKTNDPAPLPPEVEETGPPRATTPARYWRGVVYDFYTGHGWSQSPMESRSYPADRPLDPTLPAGFELLQEYQVVERIDSTLYAVNAPLSVDHPVRAWWRAAGDLAQLEGDVDRYAVISLPPEPTVLDLRAAPAVLPPDLQERYLVLPDTIPQRVLDLAQQLSAGAETQYDQAKAIEGYLRTYTYTLDLPAPPQDRDVVDYFLFDLKKGFCDYYASAMVVMARSVGLPARFASGYAQGSYDFEQARWQVTELNAHSWVEVYFEGIGWVEFEPTAGLPTLERPAGERPAGPAGPPAATGAVGSIPWGLAIEGGVVLLLMVAIVLLWRPRRRPILAAAGLIRDRYTRLLTWGGRLGQPAEDGQTPYEYGAALHAGLATRAGSRQSMTRRAGLEAPAQADQLTGSFVRAQYSAEPIGEWEGWQIRVLWNGLRRHLWWLWVSRVISFRSRTGPRKTRR